MTTQDTTINEANEEVTPEVTPEATAEEATVVVLPETEGYIKAIGRRKTATARVRLSTAKKMSITVNGKKVTDYFPTEEHVKVVEQPFVKSKIDDTFEITVIVRGGGIHAQAEAIRHGISRCLVTLSDNALRSPLKKAGLLKRDPRRKERKKPGLRKARKSPQWSKR